MVEHIKPFGLAPSNEQIFPTPPSLERLVRPLKQVNTTVATTRYVLYQLPNTRTSAVISSIMITNPTGGAVEVRLYLHIGTGTPIYSTLTALLYNQIIATKDHLLLHELVWGIADIGTRLTIESDTNLGLTATCFGVESVRTN